MTTPIPSRRRFRRIGKTFQTMIATGTAAVALVACSNTSGTSTTGGGAAAEAFPPASAEARQAAVEKGFMSDEITFDSLNPVIQRAIDKAATPLTDDQWAKLQECLKATSCETGRGTLTVALANDGINPWRQTWRAEFTAAAIQSPQVKKIVYSLGVEVPKWIANVRSHIAQQADIIIMNSVYGAAVLPALQSAKQAGVKVVQVGTPLPEEVRSQLSGEADDDLCKPYQDTAAELIKRFPNGGTYGLYTGIPGNGSAAIWQPCLTKALNAAGWKKSIEGFTQWTEQGMAQQGNALFASGKKPDFVAYDYALEDFSAPFLKAGQTPPILASDALNSAFLQQAKDARDKGVEMEAYISSSRVWYSRIGLELGLYLEEGKTIENFMIPSGAATLDTLLEDFDPAMPANAPVPHFFTAEQEEWILSAQG